MSNRFSLLKNTIMEGLLSSDLDYFFFKNRSESKTKESVTEELLIQMQKNFIL